MADEGAQVGSAYIEVSARLNRAEARREINEGLREVNAELAVHIDKSSFNRELATLKVEARSVDPIRLDVDVDSTKLLAQRGEFARIGKALAKEFTEPYNKAWSDAHTEQERRTADSFKRIQQLGNAQVSAFAAMEREKTKAWDAAYNEREKRESDSFKAAVKEGAERAALTRALEQEKTRAWDDAHNERDKRDVTSASITRRLSEEKVKAFSFMESEKTKALDKEQKEQERITATHYKRVRDLDESLMRDIAKAHTENNRRDKEEQDKRDRPSQFESFSQHVLTSLPGRFFDNAGPGAASAAVQSVAVAAPLISAALSSALIAGIGLAGIGAGIALSVSSSPAVKAAFADLGHTLLTELQHAAGSFDGPLIKSASILKAAFASAMPSLQRMFEALSTALEPLATGLGDMVKILAPALERAAVAAGPLLAFFGSDVIPSIAKALAGLISDIAAEGPALSVGMLVLEGAVVGTIDAVRVLLTSLNAVVVVLDKITGGLPKEALSWAMNNSDTLLKYLSPITVFTSGSNDATDSANKANDATTKWAESLGDLGPAGTAAVAMIATLTPVVAAYTAQMTAALGPGKAFADAMKLASGPRDEGVNAALANSEAVNAAKDRAQSIATSQVAANQSVADSTRAMADAQRSASQSIAGANAALTSARTNVAEAIKTASDTVVSAQKKELDAQKSLTQARVDAVRQLQDMAVQTAELGDSEEAARLRLARAQIAAQGVVKGPTNTLDERDKLLALSEAEHGLTDTLTNNARTLVDNAAAQRKGVEGSDSVVSSKQALLDAHKAEGKAEADLVKARSDGAKQIADAQQKVADAQISASESIASAGRSLNTALTAQTKAYQDNTSSTDINTSAGSKNTKEVQTAFDAKKKLQQAWLDDPAILDKSGPAIAAHWATLMSGFDKEQAALGRTHDQLTVVLGDYAVIPPQVFTAINLAGAEKIKADLDYILARLAVLSGDPAALGVNSEKMQPLPPAVPEGGIFGKALSIASGKTPAGQDLFGRPAHTGSLGKGVSGTELPSLESLAAPAAGGKGFVINIADNIDMTKVAPKMDEIKKLIHDKWAETWGTLDTPAAIDALNTSMDIVQKAILEQWKLTLYNIQQLWTNQWKNAGNVLKPDVITAMLSIEATMIDQWKLTLSNMDTLSAQGWGVLWGHVVTSAAGGMNKVVGVMNDGITKINAVLTATGITFQVPAIAAVAGADLGPAPKGNAAGGFIRGPGTTTSDDIVAYLSDQEYVLKAAAVRKIGVDKLNRLNDTGDITTLWGDTAAMGFKANKDLNFAEGGPVDASVLAKIVSIKAWLEQQKGKPYQLGANGPDAWDCSSLVGAVLKLSENRNPVGRIFSTGDEAKWFSPGFGGLNDLNVGIQEGHTAGSIGGLDFEGTPPKMLVGRTFQPPGTFPVHMHHTIGAGPVYTSHGGGGGTDTDSSTTVPTFDAVAAMSQVTAAIKAVQATFQQNAMGQIGSGFFSKLGDGIKTKADAQAAASSIGGGGGGGGSGAPLTASQGSLQAQALAQAKSMNASAKVLLAMMETGYTESNWTNSSAHTDHDSEGVYQQRVGSGAWGTSAQIASVPYATRSFVSRAIRNDASGKYATAGQLAQSVQVSAFGERYDQRRAQAIAALNALGETGPFTGFAGGGQVSSGIYDTGGYVPPGASPINKTSGHEQILTPGQSTALQNRINQAPDDRAVYVSVLLDGELIVEKAKAEIDKNNVAIVSGFRAGR